MTIWKNSPTPAWAGTGFMINQGGQILTCYHVIRGASQLTVYQDKNVYGEVQVVAIAPDYDLAILQLANFPTPAPYLQLSEANPSQYFDEQLKVRGSPNGLSGSEFDAKTNKRDYQPSGMFRTPDDRKDPIFQSPDVNLIQLSMTAVYGGMSGGPVISKGRVVGVLSGSFNEGGSIAWAIPAMYAAESRMRAIHRPVSQMTNWPELSMMRSNTFNGLRFDVSISAGLMLALDSYVSGVDEFARGAEDYMGQFDELARLTTQIVDAMDSARASRKEAVQAKATLLAITDRAAILRRDVSNRKKQLFDRQKVLVDRWENLRSEFEGFQHSLPDTPLNQARVAKANNSMVVVRASLALGGLELANLSLDIIDKFKAIISRMTKARSNSAVRKLLVEEKGLLEDASRRNASQIASIVASFRKIGDVAESLLDSRDQDARTPEAK